MDVLGVGLDRGRVGRLLAALGEELGEADDRVERRPELVAHRGEEVALCRARGLEIARPAARARRGYASRSAARTARSRMSRISSRSSSRNSDWSPSSSSSRPAGQRLDDERHRDGARALRRRRRRPVGVDRRPWPASRRRTAWPSVRGSPRSGRRRRPRQRIEVADEVVGDRLLAQPAQCRRRRERGEVAQGGEQRDDANDDVQRRGRLRARRRHERAAEQHDEREAEQARGDRRGRQPRARRAGAVPRRKANATAAAPSTHEEVDDQPEGQRGDGRRARSDARRDAAPGTRRSA